MENNPIIITIGEKSPILTVIGGMHGNEHIGIKVFEKLMNNITLRKGTLRFVIANPAAVSKNIRFLESDLNRSFPGVKSGNLEENLASNILEACKDSDLLLDFHTCPTPTPAFTITRGDKKQLNLARICGIERCIVYPLSLQGGASLIDYVDCGIGFELGSHDEEIAITRGYEVVTRVLKANGMIDDNTIEEKKTMKIYEVTGAITRHGDAQLEDSIENFKMIKKTNVYAKDNGKELIAEEDFIPVLFAVRRYNKLIGLKAKEITS